ncbi:inositol monophosphatase family protein [Devosia sp.]|uniref:inositol monophosphatase family protein n=1 Tax=Devosia sp. TaxID=1871048 RepID=UPI00086B9188|nr:inositol monophosphatase [Devosia sp.]ODT77893.1 MAG: hypothetical protein ABS76_25920 [Pelagibacterium sp. SCN 64-44]
MTNIADETIIATAIAAARAAGQLARDAFMAGQLGRPPDIEEKDGYFDIVTATDREAERVASTIIMDQIPDSRILGEETGWRGTGGTTWIIDPIDGTSNFASGLPFFCVSLGAFDAQNQPVCGVIYDPIREELFLSSKDGLTLNGKPVRCAAFGRTDRDVELLTNMPHEGARPTPGQLAQFADLVESFRGVRRLGSCALQLAYVAVGRVAVGYDEKFQMWDIAAGFQLVVAGGGQLLAWDADGRAIAEPMRNLSKIRRFLVASQHFDANSSAATKQGSRPGP